MGTKAMFFDLQIESTSMDIILTKFYPTYKREAIEFVIQSSWIDSEHTTVLLQIKLFNH